MSRRRRVRIGIRLQLMLVASILVGIPVLGYRYAQELRRFVFEGQERAQLLAARAIATVLHDRDDLFDPTFGLPLPLTDEHRLVAHLLPEAIMLDGDASDWGNVASEAQTFGADYLLHSPHAYDAANLGLQLAVGLRGEFVYLFATVSDDHLLYRDPQYLRLDHSDHLRLYAQDAYSELRRYVILAPEPGTGTAYMVTEAWDEAVGEGEPQMAIRSEWRETPGGYTVEVRFPMRLLGRDPRLAMLVADVDDVRERTVESLLGTVQLPRAETLNRLLVRSPEIDKILRGLDRPGMRVWVVDRQQRVRAVQGGQEADSRRHVPPGDGALDAVARFVATVGRQTPAERDGTPTDAPTVRDQLVADALAGDTAVRRMVNPHGRGLLAAAHPIWSGGTAMGAVVVEQSESEVLALQRQAIERMLVATLGVFAAITTVLLAFAWFLALRIRRLRNRVEAAIDAHGRVRLDHFDADTAAGDEIGDLSRAFSAMLQRLAASMRYLELVPRALKHEMQNPLNTVSTSLENLTANGADNDEHGYLAAAHRGVRRLGAILVSLTEATSIEAALRQEMPAPVDLNALVGLYVENMAGVHRNRTFLYKGPGDALTVMAADFLIEQMLDKLIENAVDFSRPDGTIEITLARQDGEARLTIANDGPTLPAALQDQLFESLVSGREPGGSDRPHLGLGLYVVRVIAEHHGGRVGAADRSEGGVVFTIHLPLNMGRSPAAPAHAATE